MYSIYLSLCRSSFDQYYIAIFHHVILALGHHLPLRLHLTLVTQFLEGVVVVDDALDERLLEICRIFMLATSIHESTAE